MSEDKEIINIKKRLDRLESNLKIISTTDDEYISTVFEAIEYNMKQQKRKIYNKIVNYVIEKRKYIEETWDKVLSKDEVLELFSDLIAYIEKGSK